MWGGNSARFFPRRLETGGVAHPGPGATVGTRIAWNSSRVYQRRKAVKINDFIPLLKKSGEVWIDTKASMLGAALAYYTAFSIAPLLMIALAVASLIFGQQAASGELAAELEGTVGPSVAAAIQDLLKNSASKPGSGPLALAIGVVV